MPAKSDIEGCLAAIRRLEAELDAATKLSEVRMIAGELRRSREALRRLMGLLARRPVRLPRRASPKRLALFVDLEPLLFQVAHDPLGELLPGIVGRVLAHDPA